MRVRIESCTGSNPPTGGEKGVREIVLTVPPTFTFHAGQYLEIQLPGANAIALSIASAPHRLPAVHLHYRSTPGLSEARLLDELLAQLAPSGGSSGEEHKEVSIRGPFGSVCLNGPLAEPLLIVAGGTGGAQAMGLLDSLLAEPPSQPVSLLWCADDARDLYRRDWLYGLHRTWLTSQCVVDPSRAKENRGLQWLRDRAPGMAEHRVILSGSPGFVYAAVDALQAQGLNPQQMASDVFSYAPR